MQTLEVLKTLITYPTITPKECGIYEFIKAFLPDFEVLELNKITQEWKIQDCCAINGDGLLEGINWIYEKNCEK